MEDDPDDQELFAIFLQNRRDIKLLPPLNNGLELIAYLEDNRGSGAWPDLIILDQNMPMMNGKQTLEALQANPEFAAVPAVVYSTYADSVLVTDCKRLGARLVILKPIDAEGYNRMMDDFLTLLSVQAHG